MKRKKKSKNAAVKSVKKAVKTKSVSGMDCEESVKERLRLFIADPQRVLGLGFIHSLDEAEYYGRIQSVYDSSGGGDFHFDVGYWGFEAAETSSVDHELDSVTFFSDAILGKVVFL